MSLEVLTATVSVGVDGNGDHAAGRINGAYDPADAALLPVFTIVLLLLGNIGLLHHDDGGSGDCIVVPGRPRTSMRSPTCNSCKVKGAAFLRSVCPGASRTMRAPSETETVISGPASVLSTRVVPLIDFTTPTFLAAAPAPACAPCRRFLLRP